MDALRAEIEARKRQNAELKERSGNGGRKFVRRGDLAAEEQKEAEARRQVSRFKFPDFLIFFVFFFVQDFMYIKHIIHNLLLIILCIDIMTVLRGQV